MATLTSILKNAVITLLFLTPAIGLSQNPFFEQMAKLPDVNYTYLSSATLSMADDEARRGPSQYSKILYIKDDGDSQEIKMILFTGDIEPDTIKKLVD